MRRSLLVSLVLHALGIALLLTIRAPEPRRVGTARVTVIASPYRAPAPVKRPPHLQPLRPPRTVARMFRVPDRLAQPTPGERTPVLPDPPSIHAAPILVPVPTPGIADIPPPQVRRVAAATGAFDGAIPSDQAVPHAEITTGNFGNATAATAPPRTLHNLAANFLAAEILSKPQPAYTDEARRLQIEGEVLLEVLFAASGKARVLRTIRGLGYGLDENAIAAAGAIQFRPAQRGGAAVDSTAVVHIVFQLAF